MSRADDRAAIIDRHERERDDLSAKHSAELDAFDDAHAAETDRRERELDERAAADNARGTGSKRFI